MKHFCTYFLGFETNLHGRGQYEKRQNSSVSNSNKTHIFQMTGHPNPNSSKFESETDLNADSYRRQFFLGIANNLICNLFVVIIIITIISSRTLWTDFAVARLWSVYSNVLSWYSAVEFSRLWNPGTTDLSLHESIFTTFSLWSLSYTCLWDANDMVENLSTSVKPHSSRNYKR